MEKMKIFAIQMNSYIGDKLANIEKAKFLINRDVNESADIIILPEVWTVGWSPDIFLEKSTVENLEDMKINDNTPALSFLSSIAQKYKSWVVGGSLITERYGKYYNTCPVFNRNGKLVCIYDKNHLFSYYGCAEGSFVTRGSSPVMVNMDGVNVGLTICYDIRFPEIYRAYRKSGADLLINVAAWGLNKPIPWECMTRARAVENQTYMVALTQSGYIKDDTYNIGHSRILDYKGETLSEIKDQNEGAMSACLCVDEMYEFREKCRCIDDIKQNYEVIKV